MSFTQCQWGQQKAVSDKSQCITPRRIRTDVRSLREPVVPQKKLTAQSEIDGDISDSDDSEFERDVLRRSVPKARYSALTRDSSLKAIARAALPGNPEYTEILAEREKLHSENNDSDNDGRLPKRRKVTSLARDGQNHNSFDGPRQQASSFYTFASPIVANLDNSRSPGSGPELLNGADGKSSRQFRRASITPMMANMDSAKHFTAATPISAFNEDSTDKSSTPVVAIHDDIDMIPGGSPKIVEQMRSAYFAKHSAAEPIGYRWITDPSNPKGPPVRENPRRRKNRNDTVYMKYNRLNLSLTWYFCDVLGAVKKICTVEHIPELVAKAYSDPTYTNEEQLISTLTNEYSGLRKEDIE